MRVLPLVVLLGCGPTTATVLEVGDDDTGIDIGTADTDTETTDTDTDPTTVPLPDFDCYAMVTSDEYTDGLVEMTQVVAFDANMFPIHYETHTGNFGPWPFDVTDYVRDADGNPTEESFDSLGDGNLDYRLVRTFDVDGNVLEQTTDMGGDGSIDDRVIYTYVGGLLDEITQDVADDGTVDARVYYTYDADDRMLAAETDVGDDGSIDSLTTYTYLLPAPSIDVAIEVDTDNDGYPEELYDVTYGLDEEMLSYVLDDDADGEPNISYFWTYLPNGDPDTISGAVSQDYPPYGLQEYDFLITYSYDDQDRQTSAYTEAFFDGADYAGYWRDEAWDWTCP